MIHRNTAVPWLYVAGGAAIGLVALRAASTLKQRKRTREAEHVLESAAEAPLVDHVWPASRPAEHQVAGAALQYRGENDVYVEPRPFIEELVDDELVDEELEVALSEHASAVDDAYDAVSPDDLGSEWLARATEATAAPRAHELLDLEVAEIFRDAGSIVSEGSLNAASAEELESTVSEELEEEEELEERDK